MKRHLWHSLSALLLPIALLLSPAHGSERPDPAASASQTLPQAQKPNGGDDQGITKDWTAVAAMGNITMAIKGDGSLWVWGERHAAPYQVDAAFDWAAVSAGDSHAVALKKDGSLWAWGKNYRSVPVQVGTAKDWAAVSAGDSHALAIRTDGSLWAWWGENYSIVPVQVGTATDWASVSAGGVHSLALKTDGSLWAWGWNKYGQLGDGTSTDRNTTPVQVGTAKDWAAVSAGKEHTLGLKTDGSLWAWGKNYSIVPVQVGTAKDWAAVAASEEHTVGLKTDGSIWAWVANNSPVQVGTAKEWAAVAAGGHHAVALKKDGSLWAWGANELGQLGDGTKKDRNAPVSVGEKRVYATDWAAVAVGKDYTVALKKDGSLWAWGKNNRGQLGLGDTLKRYAPVQVGKAKDWAAVAAGKEHTLGLKTDGSLWAWGRNEYGQLGDGTSTDRNTTPVQVGTAKDWAAVAAGEEHTVALKKDGSLWAWGSNTKGQLGLGDTLKRYAPVQVGTVKE